MIKVFCDRCKGEIKDQPVEIRVTFPSLDVLRPSLNNGIDHQYCQHCWDYLRDIALNGKDLEYK